MKIHAILFFAALVWIFAPVVSSADPTTAPLVQQGDIEYLGAFRMSSSGADNLQNGGRGAGVDGNRLFIGCSRSLDQMAEVQIPEPSLDPVYDNLPIAPITQPCADVSEGTINTTLPKNTEIRGSMMYGGRLALAARQYYGCNIVPTHATVDDDFSVIGDLIGWDTNHDNLGTKPRGLTGYLGHIPTEWQPILEAPAFTGWGGGQTAKGCSSFGYSFTTLNPDEIGTGQMIGKTLAFFPDQKGETEWTLFNWLQSTLTVGAAFPSGTRSILFVMQQGDTQCYGLSTDDPALEGKLVYPDDPTKDLIYCYSPNGVGIKGVHSYPFHAYLVAVDVNTLLAVKDGTLQPNEALYYGKWELPDINEGGGINLLSATYDDLSGRLYIVPRYQDGGTKPIVYVYHINRMTPFEACVYNCQQQFPQ